jgi:hypothetical protein
MIIFSLVHVMMYHRFCTGTSTCDESVEKVPWPLRFLQENRPIKQVTKDFFNTLCDKTGDRVFSLMSWPIGGLSAWASRLSGNSLRSLEQSHQVLIRQKHRIRIRPQKGAHIIQDALPRGRLQAFAHDPAPVVQG